MVRVVGDWREAVGITHPAPHHADEVFATAMLMKIFGDDGDFPVCRTRDKSIIKQAKKANGRHIIYDVGGEYDSGRKLFDHHQKDFREWREAQPGQKRGVKYASAGLVWRRYGMRISRTCALNARLDYEGWDSVVRSVDESLIKGIDAFDNGEVEDGLMMSASTVIQQMNTAGRELVGSEVAGVSQSDMNFIAACVLAGEILRQTIMQAVEKELEKAAIAQMIEQSSGDQFYLVLDKPYSAWREAILSLSAEKDKPGVRGERSEIAKKATKICFCIFPRIDNSGQWCVQAVPPSAHELMKQRESFPSSWRGLEGDKLAFVSGVEDAIFCHTAGFFASAKTLEGARQLAFEAHLPYVCGGRV